MSRRWQLEHVDRADAMCASCDAAVDRWRELRRTGKAGNTACPTTEPANEHCEHCGDPLCDEHANTCESCLGQFCPTHSVQQPDGWFYCRACNTRIEDKKGQKAA